MPEHCVRCGRELLQDEVGATKKLINRGATEFYCLPCLGDRFQVPTSLLQQKIEEWRAAGCMLFPPKE